VMVGWATAEAAISRNRNTFLRTWVMTTNLLGPPWFGSSRTAYLG
jgi:hypothetical protein